jgi:hypothetical protein
MNRSLLTLIILLSICAISKAQVALPPVVPPFDVNVNGTPAIGHIFTSAIDMSGPNSDWPSTIMLMDNEGDLIYYLPFSDSSIAPYPRKAIGDFKLHVDGRMSFTDALFGTDSSIYIMDSTFFIIDTIYCSPGYKLDGHDFQITSDGHYHLLAMEERIMDASSLTTEGGETGDVNCTVTGHIIQEYDANKNLIREWKSLDHFSINDTYEYYFTDPLNLEHAHINSLFIDYEGNYIISSRSLNEITRINRLTGQIIWRLGGLNNEFTFLDDPLQFTAQHDAQYYSDGTVVLFDNATNTLPDHVSRMLEYQMDTVAMTVSSVLKFQHPLNLPSGFMGSARKLDSNHFIINWGGGYDYAIGSSIQEFDGLWNETLEIDFSPGFAPYRAVKSIIPWKINRPEINCNGSTMTLSTVQNHATYLWSTGETTPSISINDIGSYQVWTDAGQGLLSSVVYEVTDLNDLCQTSNSITEIDIQNLIIYPNPTDGDFSIDLGNNYGDIIITITDLNGQFIQTKKYDQAQILHLSIDEPSATYLLTIKIENKSKTIKLIKK